MIYYEVQEQLAEVRQDFQVAHNSRDIDGVLTVCDRLIYIIGLLNEENAPQ